MGYLDEGRCRLDPGSSTSEGILVSFVLGAEWSETCDKFFSCSGDEVVLEVSTQG